LKFKIDENLSLEYAPILRAAGFVADTVADENLRGVADLVLAERTRSERRVLITLDLDFANIRSLSAGCPRGYCNPSTPRARQVGADRLAQ
jgi:predicted nuclease of predicted toxin-antitoxin system